MSIPWAMMLFVMSAVQHADGGSFDIRPHSLVEFSAKTTVALQRQSLQTKGIEWRCVDNRCLANMRIKDALDILTACRALSELVGRLKKFSWNGRELNRFELAQCRGLSPVKYSRPSVDAFMNAPAIQQNKEEKAPNLPPAIFLHRDKHH